ncbi:MAG: ABC-F family ATP-binding cassette domain-containing protein [Lachnospiraceae bacterium]|nr:ABC-F family ATP-binding cassette domain-containing protein [Lachnospiraceae bacterium]
MNVLSLDDVSLAFGQRKIFDHCSFFLQEGEKVGIIGINGTGKSTLLKLIAGLEEPDEGKRTLANNHLVRFLPQSPTFPPEETVLEAVMKDNRREDNATTLEGDAKSMLTRLGVTDFSQPCGELSGGQRKRLALVSVLLSPAEILVLDEPTNHLDGEMSDWLEKTLRNYRGTLCMVTHDRYFLNSVCNRIVEVDKGSLYSYEANYAGYLELKMQREDMERASARKRASILRTELAWVQRGARARTTKQKARLERFEELKNAKGPVEDGRVEISSLSSRLGRTTVELSNVSKSYGDQVLIKDFSYNFLRDDRVGFIGPNGCGKSTLMKIILGLEKQDAGTVEIGQTVKISYYAQETDTTVMNPSQRVIDYIRDEAEFVETPEGKISAAKMLEKFLFEGEDQYGLLGKLSGGERRRLHLCKVLMSAPNILILDEPTNDLDVTTLQILEDYLDGFPGIVITVSHDRYFLDRIVRRIFAFEKGGVLKQYEGGYTDYAIRRDEILAAAANHPEGSAVPSRSDADKNAEGSSSANWRSDRKRKLKFSYQEQKDYETIESEIEAIEEKIAKLDQDYLKHSSDFIKLGQIAKEKEEAEALLEQKMDRWAYLEDLAIRIENGEYV